MKQRLLLFLTLLLASFGGARATEVTIGSLEGAEGFNLLPMSSNYEKSYSQQIYTADEIGTAGTINSITVWLYGNADLPEMNLKIYMKEVNKQSFTSETDWVSVSDADVVYDGSVTVHNTVAQAYTFTLDTPFEYGGTGNLLICFNKWCDTGTWKSGLNGMAFTASDNVKRSIYVRRSNNDYDPAAMSGITAFGTSAKRNVIQLDITSASSVAVPSNVTISYTGGDEATVSWTSDASAFDIDVNGEVTENVTNPYTLTGLSLSTTYAVKVRAKAGEEVSIWSSPQSFTTDDCMLADKCVINFDLTDAVGDGWGISSIYVVDMDAEAILGSFTNTSAAGAGEAQHYTLSVCPGKEIMFQWLGYDDEECSYVVTDAQGDVIFEGAGGMSDAVSYTVDCTVSDYKRPSNLTASEMGSRSVMLNWTDNSLCTVNEWVVAYKVSTADDFTTVTATEHPFLLTGLDPETTYVVKVRPAADEAAYKWSTMVTFTTDIAFPAPKALDASVASTSAEISWITDAAATGTTLQYAEGLAGTGSLQYDNGILEAELGYETAAEWTWGVMYPGSMVAGHTLTKVSLYETDANTETITINVYSGGDDAPGTLLYTEAVTPEAGGAFHEVTLATPVAIKPGKNLWITLTENGTSVMPYCESDEPNNNWVQVDGVWAHISDVTPYVGLGWMIRAELDGATDPELLTWTTVANPSNPYQLTELTPETYYTVRVKASYDGGESTWAVKPFTTLEVAEILFAKEGYATYYNSLYDVVLPAGMQANIVTGGDDNANVDYEVIADGDTQANIVPAGTAVMLRMASAEAEQVLTVGLASPTAAPITQTNLLYGSDTETTTYGDDDPDTVELFYKLSYPEGGGKLDWYWGAPKGAAFTSEAHRAWLVLVISPKTADIVFSKEGFATYYNSYHDAVLPAGMKARIVTAANGDNTLTYETIADGDTEANIVPAGTGMMLQVATAADDQVHTIYLDTPTADPITQTNLLRGSDADRTTYVDATWTSPDVFYYKLTYYPDKTGEFGWFWGAEGGAAFTNPAHRCWLALDNDNDPNKVSALPAFEGITGIQSVAKNSVSAEGWYTINGVKLDKQPTTKGLYIHNGKKMVVE